MIKYCLNKKSLGRMCWFERKERYVVCIYNLELKLFVVEGNNFFFRTIYIRKWFSVYEIIILNNCIYI